MPFYRDGLRNGTYTGKDELLLPMLTVYHIFPIKWVQYTNTNWPFSQQPLGVFFKFALGHSDLLVLLLLSLCSLLYLQVAPRWVRAMAPVLPSNPCIYEPVAGLFSVTDAVSASPNSLDVVNVMWIPLHVNGFLEQTSQL